MILLPQQQGSGPGQPPHHPQPSPSTDILPNATEAYPSLASFLPHSSQAPESPLQLERLF